MKSGVLIAFVMWGSCCRPVAAATPREVPTGVLRVATCQFPVSADVHTNAEWIRAQMREARQQSADIAHFSESALSGYASLFSANRSAYRSASRISKRTRIGWPASRPRSCPATHVTVRSSSSPKTS